MYYVIRSNVMADPSETVQVNELHQRILALAGRNPLRQYASVARRFRERGRIYIATDRGTTGRELYGQGFIVERIDA